MPRTHGAYARLYRETHPVPEGGAFAGQCECFHWTESHCAECGACQKCNCEAFEGV